MADVDLVADRTMRSRLATKSAKHIRHRCRASRRDPDNPPSRSARRSPNAASSLTVPMISGGTMKACKTGAYGTLFTNPAI